MANGTQKTEAGYNQRINAFITETIALGGSVDMNSPDAVGKRVGLFVELAHRYDCKLTISGIALALGLSRDEYNDYRTGKTGRNSTVQQMLQRFANMIEMQVDLDMQNGKLNPVTGIFVLKSDFGRTETENAKRDKAPLDAVKEISAIEQKYLDSVVEVAPSEDKKSSDKKKPS